MSLRNRHLYHDENIFFITTTCYQWIPLLSVGHGFEIISDNLKFYCKKYLACILGYVIMPNHIHLILHFQEGTDRSSFMRDFKKYTSFMIRKEVMSNSPELLERLRINDNKQVFKIWIDRYDETYLITRAILETKLDYIHTNPLQEKWSLVKSPEDYDYSSARFYETGIQTEIEVVHYGDFI